MLRLSFLSIFFELGLLRVVKACSMVFSTSFLFALKLYLALALAMALPKTSET